MANTNLDHQKNGYINSLLFYDIGHCYLGLTNRLAMIEDLMLSQTNNLAMIEDLMLSRTNSLAMIEDLVLSLLTSCQTKLCYMRDKLQFYPIIFLLCDFKIIFF